MIDMDSHGLINLKLRTCLDIGKKAHRNKSVESGILHISNLRFVSLFKWEYGKYWHETSCLQPDEEIVSVSAL